MKGRLVQLTLVIAAACVATGDARAERPAALRPARTFPITVTVALEAGQPARDASWVTAQIDVANGLYGPLGITFRQTGDRTMPARHANQHTREDRDALAPLASTSTIDVFVVTSLEDVDEPGRMRRGVAWTSRTDQKRYIILSSIAQPGVLAHELGHFFGNGHSDVPDNLMSYTRTPNGTVFLDDAQVARVQSFATRFLASGRLTDVTRRPSAP
ncbi:MAG: hypothetical protein JWP97_1762 [Labilithrix sp.]|nr:hypothetical protein [Labilithrix sp.]